ncbi:MAG: hypothetical protein A3J48_00445 [Candidatus Doudnabacteria bacterium RIFCSPHIGHO2_02_FULL_46_11]|uniref:DUF1648 domain-containing protein n=1 Tax=Candidatus Doudnabacteria bacterium RIFCSPHIGHO2_02_FULL_46_11 TaxID=1817832 RepID=A0A1F5P557_9BACT|nr:MAG: hypothetical protein A3J48_00445 [Candidatus Doudnabacteria bacterium RIFCSPHIGHO2_02_FULL_46_11]
MGILKLKYEQLAGKLFPRLKSSPTWFQDSFIFWGSVSSFLLIIILILIILFKLRPSSELVAVHYNVLIGVDLVQRGWYFYVLPLIAVLVLSYNIFLARKFHGFESFASYLLITASILASGILLAAAAALMYLP